MGLSMKKQSPVVFINFEIPTFSLVCGSHGIIDDWREVKSSRWKGYPVQ